MAQLRVFEPIEELAPVERLSAEAAIERGRALSRSGVRALERRVALGQLREGPMTEALVRAVGAVEVRRVGQRTHVCPLLLERRVAQAVVAGHRELDPRARSSLLGASAPAAAERVLQHVDRRLFVREHAWRVPLAWFLAFRVDERHEVRGTTGGAPRVTYLTQVGPGRTRLTEVGSTLVEAGVLPSSEVAIGVERLHTWLRAFDEVALLELDYGELATWLGADGVADERTLEHLLDGVAALEREDPLGALQARGRAQEAWAELASVDGAS